MDLTDKGCPCDRGWICDSAANRCIRDGAGEGGDGAIRVQGLRGEHPTSNQILWTWAVSGDEADFDHYVLATAGTLEDLIDGRVTAWGPSERAELAVLAALTGEHAASTEHPPDTEVFAQLVAVDQQGVAFASNVASARTLPEASNEVVILDDAIEDLIGLDWVEEASDGPARGAVHHCLRVWCDPGGGTAPSDPGAGAPATCGANVQFAVSPVDVSGVDLERGFLEAAIRIEGGTAHRRLGRVYFFLARPACEAQCETDWEHTDCQQCYWRREPLAFTADGTYHTVQVALPRFASHADSDSRLDAAELEAPLTQIAIGADWQHGSRVCFDAIRMRY